jgi:hypothetical protein
MYIINDVVSYNRKTTYAKSGDKVKIIADFVNVAIVENSKVYVSPPYLITFQNKKNDNKL